MTTDDVSYLRQLREVHNKRLQQLQLRQASLGIGSPPELGLEIEDIQTKMKEVDNKINILLMPGSFYLHSDGTQNIYFNLGNDSSPAEEPGPIIKAVGNFFNELRVMPWPRSLPFVLLIIFNIIGVSLHFVYGITDAAAIASLIGLVVSILFWYYFIAKKPN